MCGKGWRVKQTGHIEHTTKCAGKYSPNGSEGCKFLCVLWAQSILLVGSMGKKLLWNLRRVERGSEREREGGVD